MKVTTSIKATALHVLGEGEIGEEDERSAHQDE